jgi:NAD(P)-dependent dehydrogenase (short-subunit alcohol dehydrogenase family)
LIRSILLCALHQSFKFSLGAHMISLAGKAALVTGGSRGIGAATVKLFAQAGADVVFSYRSHREAAGQVEQEARNPHRIIQGRFGENDGSKKARRVHP